MSFVRAIVIALLALFTSALQADGDGPPQKYDLIGDGGRIELNEKGFTIVPPTGWEVFTSQPGLSLLMQVPYERGKYQRTIQVASFNGSRYMDDVTAREYEKYVVRKFSQVSSTIEDYKVRNHVPIDMADGRKGLLFYTEFRMHGVDLMQAHVLVSAPSRHYLVTYTDIAAHFERDEAAQFLTEAWDSMISVQLDGATPQRYQLMKVSTIAVTAIFVLLSIVLLVRKVRAGRRYRELGEGHGLDDVELTRAEKFIVASSPDEPLTGMDPIDDDVGNDKDEEDMDEGKDAAGSRAPSSSSRFKSAAGD